MLTFREEGKFRKITIMYIANQLVSRRVEFTTRGQIKDTHKESGTRSVTDTMIYQAGFTAS